MDWAQQPDPFRRYNGAPLVRLALPDAGRALPYWQLYVAENMVPAPLSVDAISLFFRYALSLTAWKGSREPHGLCVPICRREPPPDGGKTRPCRPWTLSTTVPAYTTMHRRRTVSSFERTLDPSVWAALTAAFPEGSSPRGAFVHPLAGGLEVWRTRVPVLPTRCRPCAGDEAIRGGCPRVETPPPRRVGNAAVSQLFGLDREEPTTQAQSESIRPVALVVREKWASDRGLCLSKELVSQVATSRRYGTANVLSPEHGVDWPVIDQVAIAPRYRPRIRGSRWTKSFPGSLRRKTFSGRQSGPVRSPRKKSSWGVEAR